MASPTGRVELRGITYALILERTFTAPIAEVWAAVTEPDRLARWIGTWTGEPSTGIIQWEMTAKGADPAPMVIRECTAPTTLKVVSQSPMGDWPLELHLSETADGTRLRFTHTGVPDEMTGSVGPGWEYYLDRLVAAEKGEDVAAISWDDYFPAMESHYIVRSSAGGC